MANNVMRYFGSISYKVRETHPDIKYIPEKDRDNVFTYSDTYKFGTEYADEDEENIISYIKHDLAVVAGGGYGTKEIYDVSYNIYRVM